MTLSRMPLPGLPALALATVVAFNGGVAAPTQADPDATGTAPERASPAAELRPSQETAPAEKRPVRVILPSPYSARR